jgi:hypothetical protein
MDEDLDRLAQRYALKLNIKLGERLGFGVHGTVFAAEDNTKPGFFAVSFTVRSARSSLSAASINVCVKSKLREFSASMCLSCCALMRNSAR